MKFIQLVSHQSSLFALADDGSVFMRTYDDENIPGKFTYDEYGSRIEATKRVFRWERIEAPMVTA
jgi:hypothetical protein